jgi:hypothetical protein
MSNVYESESILAYHGITMTLEEQLFNFSYAQRKDIVNDFKKRWRAALLHWNGKPLDGIKSLVLLGNNENRLVTLLESEGNHLQEIPIEIPQCWLPDGEGFAYVLHPEQNGQPKSIVLETKFNGRVSVGYAADTWIGEFAYIPGLSGIIYTNHKNSKYLSSDTLFHHDFLSRETKKIHEGIDLSEPEIHVSKDSRWVMYQGESNIWICDLEHFRKSKIASGVASPLGFTNKGQALIEGGGISYVRSFYGEKWGGDKNHYSGIYSIDVRNEIRSVHIKPALVGSALSSSGRALASFNSSMGPRDISIRLIDADAPYAVRAAYEIGRNAIDNEFRDPFWAPGGDKVFFHVNYPGKHIVSYNALHLRTKKITSVPIKERNLKYYCTRIPQPINAA